MLSYQLMSASYGLYEKLSETQWRGAVEWLELFYHRQFKALNLNSKMDELLKKNFSYKNQKSDF